MARVRGDEMTLFVNGQLSGENVFTGTRQVNDQAIRLGGEYVPGSKCIYIYIYIKLGFLLKKLEMMYMYIYIYIYRRYHLCLPRSH